MVGNYENHEEIAIYLSSLTYRLRLQYTEAEEKNVRNVDLIHNVVKWLSIFINPHLV